MKHIITLLLLTLVGCADCEEPVSPMPDDTTTEPVSCEVIAQGEEDLVLQFSDPNIAAPGGLDCVSLGGGVFDCKPDFCIVVYYPGNCPQCPYTNAEGSSGE